MTYSVTFYCPDTHLVYNLHTLDKQGIGGGVTSRIRMAHALAELGHRVTIYNNCPKKQNIDNVHYIPYQQSERIYSDIFIASTSGDGLDLSSLERINIIAKLQILMVHGIDPPHGIDLSEFDYFYAHSEFIRQLIVEVWGIDPIKLFTAYRGIKDNYYHLTGGELPQRDQFGIVYASHPAKGLGPAREILKILIEAEPRFSLNVYGGFQLWGEEERDLDTAPGVTYHGMIGQQALAHELQKYSYALNIQDREEPFGMSVIEAMKAGCIVLASSVGAFPEIIQTGYDGFLIKGRSSDDSTLQSASGIILDLVGNEEQRNQISSKAIVSPHSWIEIAQAWQGHWDWALGRHTQTRTNTVLVNCFACKSEILSLSDGMHCVGCGRYFKSISQ